MASRKELIEQLLQKQFEFGGHYVYYGNSLIENHNHWRTLYTIPQDAKVRWLNWGAGFLQKELGLSQSRSQAEMEMLDTMYGLKTY